LSQYLFGGTGYFTQIPDCHLGRWRRNRKNKDDFDPAKNQWTHNFANVDVTGGSAAVKVELSHNGKHVYTDYLSLLRFDSGWKIVAKVYHNHSRE